MINTITLNPAIDCILFIDRFERNVTARVREKTEALGGKGVHISVNLALMGERSQAFGVLFGEVGRRIERELAEIGVTTRFVFGSDGSEGNDGAGEPGRPGGSDGSDGSGVPGGPGEPDSPDDTNRKCRTNRTDKNALDGADGPLCGGNREGVTGRAAKNSRTNYVVVEESGGATIIADQGVSLSSDEVDMVLDTLLLHSNEGDSLVLSGDASNAGDPEVYARFIRAFRQHKGEQDKGDGSFSPVQQKHQHQGRRVYVDASGQALAKAIEAAPFLIKPSRDEMEGLTGEKIEGETDALRAIRSLDRFGIENIALTLGAEGSIVRFGETFLRALPPEVPVKNTIGCGDAFMAGLIAGFAQGLSAEQTLRKATSVAAATAASPLTVGFDPGYADSLFDKIGIETL